MGERLKKYRRWEDYYSLRSLEVKIAISITVIFMFFLFKVFGIYEIFNTIKADLKQIILYILSAEFALLGTSLAGMAIITSVMSPDFIKIINHVDKQETVNRVLSHFEFSSLNLAIQIVYLLIIYFSLMCNTLTIGKNIFFICCGFICYHFFFNLFYIIALIGECIEIYTIKNQCKKVMEIEKSIIDIANEIRIDYILALLLQGSSRERLLKELFEIIDKSNISNQQYVKEYLKRWYGREEE